MKFSVLERSGETEATPAVSDSGCLLTVSPAASEAPPGGESGISSDSSLHPFLSVSPSDTETQHCHPQSCWAIFIAVLGHMQLAHELQVRPA